MEAYKKPEFEVTVKPVEPHLLKGQTARVRIAARYYFGGPVAGGRVRYRVLRAAYEAAAPPAKAFDWLYGPGYGQYGYRYPWLHTAKGHTALADPEADPDEEERHDSDRSELVTLGEARLDARGVVELSVNEAPAPYSFNAGDHRLIFEVEVRDESRRTITGRGQVLVTGRDLAATLELDRGWYLPNSEAVAAVTLRTAFGEGTGAAGTLRLTRITYAGPANRETRQEVLRTWEVKTNRRGRLTTRVAVRAEGQYRLEFQTRDSRDQPVLAETVFWVHGPRFDGKAFRYADLEIIPDRPSYQVGDTAHLLVHVAQANARVLWNSDVWLNGLAGYRFLDIPTHTTVIDLPIRDRHVPNHFVEATVVSNGRVSTEACELFVPPVNDLLRVAIHTDKGSYRPRQQGNVRITVSDSAGKPVSGQVTLAVYDKAVTYIEEETGPGPNALIARRKMSWYADTKSSFDMLRGGSSGRFVCPEFEIYEGGLPGIGGIGGSPPTGGEPADTGPREPRVTRRGGPPHRGPGEADRPEKQPVVRSNFADTALWKAALELGPDGTAAARLPFPDSLTTWRLRAWAITERTQVGDATSEVVTTKSLLVRLQTPRFLVEGDDVVLSANIHNARKTDQRVAAELLVPADLFRYRGTGAKSLGTDRAGNLRLCLPALVKAGATGRCDWPLHVVKVGLATVTVKARGDDESDAMQLAVPVLGYGTPEYVARTGQFRPGEEGEKTVALNLPDKIDFDQTRLEVTVSPGPIGPMLDALPFLSDYPYGCTEQTMSRFYPAIICAETLKKLGTNLEAIGKRRSQIGSGRFRAPAEPVYDSGELRRMAEAGLQRLANFQHKDGGWGWWQGDASSTYMTAYVLMGLQTAHEAGYPVQPWLLEDGYRYLHHQIDAEGKRQATEPAADERHTDTLVAYVLAREGPKKIGRPSAFGDQPTPDALARKHRQRLFQERDALSAYGKLLLALALHHGGESKRARLVLRALLATARRDDKKATAWVPSSSQGWWHWWNSEVETNAWALRALLAIDPQNELVPRLARWLMEARSSGHYWRSTRDTALAIAALADYLTARKNQAAAQCRVVLRVNGTVARTLDLTPDNFLKLDHRLVLTGKEFPPGRHRIRITKTGPGELFFACRLGYFRKGAFLRAQGNRLAIKREYFRVTAGGAAAKQPLRKQDRLAAGDLIEVVLRITADNAYDYLALEDPKPAGCEPVQLQSGGGWLGNRWVDVELRDARVVIFVPYLDQGAHVFRYRLRAETPGRFRSLPAEGFAMYAAEIRARSDAGELVIGE